MKRLTDNAVCRKLSESFGTLCEYSVGIDHDVKLSLYADDTAHSPVYSCQWQGAGRKRLWLCLAIVGAAVLIVALLRRLCSLISE